MRQLVHFNVQLLWTIDGESQFTPIGLALDSCALWQNLVTGNVFADGNYYFLLALAGEIHHIQVFHATCTHYFSPYFLTIDCSLEIGAGAHTWNSRVSNCLLCKTCKLYSCHQQKYKISFHNRILIINDSISNQAQMSLWQV